MKHFLRTGLAGFLCLITTQLSPAQSIDNVMLSSMKETPTEGAFSMEGYWVWGASVIRDDEGTYHMYAARWPGHLTFHPGWMIASDIVHAVSDSPVGPYKFVDVALPVRGAQYWDGRSAFNPKICRYKDTYVLTYTGSTHPFPDFPEDDSLTLNSKYSIIGRSNKRIGIAYSKSPNGPWTRLDQPALPTKPNTFYSFLTSNPAPWINEDGSVVLIFKSRSYNRHFPYHSSMKIGVATAPSFMGPYRVVSNEPIFGEGKMAEVEDPTIWKDQEGYHMLAKDQLGKITGSVGHGILAHSDDAVQWELDAKPYAYTKTIRWDDGTETTMGQLERVGVLLDEHDKVTHLIFATMDGPGGFNHSTRSWNIVVPLKR